MFCIMTMNDSEEVYRHFGHAAEMAQVLELAAGNLALVYITMWFDPKAITLDQRKYFQSLIDDSNSRTFGNLIRILKDAATMPDNMIALLDLAVEKRNYLIHHFFRTHNFAIGSEDGRLAMCAELQDIYSTLSTAQAMLAGMAEALSKAFNRSPVSESFAQELMERGKRVNI